MALWISYVSGSFIKVVALQAAFSKRQASELLLCSVGGAVQQRQRHFSLVGLMAASCTCSTVQSCSARRPPRSQQLQAALGPLHADAPQIWPSWATGHAGETCTGSISKFTLRG